MKTFGEPRLLMTSGLLQAGRQWRRLAGEVLVDLDISEATATALLWVKRLGGGVRQVTLATYVGIEGTSLVRLLDQLSALGLLERRDDPQDRRAKTIWLTPEGARVAKRIEAALGTLRKRIFQDVSEEDVEAVLRVFEALERASVASRDAALDTA